MLKVEGWLGGFLVRCIRHRDLNPIPAAFLLQPSSNLCEPYLAPSSFPFSRSHLALIPATLGSLLVDSLLPSRTPAGSLLVLGFLCTGGHQGTPPAVVSFSPAICCSDISGEQRQRRVTSFFISGLAPSPTSPSSWLLFPRQSFVSLFPATV